MMRRRSGHSAFSDDINRIVRAFLRYRAGEFLVVGLGAYLASRTLARLSGTALWVPAEWREAIDIIVGALGGAVFVGVRSFLNFYNPGVPLFETGATKRITAAQAEKALRAREIKERRKKKNDLWILGFSVLFILLALVTLGLFMWLRASCVIAFDTRDWLETQRLQNSVDRARDLQTLNSPKLKADLMPLELKKDVEIDPDKMPHIPPFVDLERQEVYLPLPFLLRKVHIAPDDSEEDVPTTRSTATTKMVKIRVTLGEYLEDLGKANDTDGLRYMLANEPDHLFDIIEKQASLQVTETNWLFLGLDTTIIVLFAVGLAGSFDVPSALGDALGRA
jgi:hypothetical protein